VCAMPDPPRIGLLIQRNVQNEGSPGYVDENKEKQMPGARCRVSGVCAMPDPPRIGLLIQRNVQNEGSPGYVDENKDGGKLSYRRGQRPAGTVPTRFTLSRSYSCPKKKALAGLLLCE